MAKTPIEELISLGSGPLSNGPISVPESLTRFSQGSELLSMLQMCNGFYSFESALLVRTVGCDSGIPLDAALWNNQSLWVGEYGDLLQGLFCFAEDIFQDQFCLSPLGIVRFVAETGEQKFLADSLEGWASAMLTNSRFETGWPFTVEWIKENGPIPAGKRLMPKIPFFLGGQYSLDNLWLGDDVDGMRFKADIARQTRALPDGAKVDLRVT